MKMNIFTVCLLSFFILYIVWVFIEYNRFGKTIRFTNNILLAMLIICPCINLMLNFYYSLKMTGHIVPSFFNKFSTSYKFQDEYFQAHKTFMDFFHSIQAYGVEINSILFVLIISLLCLIGIAFTYLKSGKNSNLPISFIAIYVLIFILHLILLEIHPNLFFQKNFFDTIQTNSENFNLIPAQIEIIKNTIDIGYLKAKIEIISSFISILICITMSIIIITKQHLIRQGKL